MSDPDAIYASPDLPPQAVYEAPSPPAPEPEKSEDPFTFTPKSTEDFESLLYLGRIEKTFRWQNHDIKVRTLTVDDHLELGLMINQWKDTYSQSMSWQAAIVAAGTISIDGKPVVLPLGEDYSEMAERFAWARRQYPWTIDKIWYEIMALEDRVKESLNAMGKAGGDPA